MQRLQKPNRTWILTLGLVLGAQLSMVALSARAASGSDAILISFSSRRCPPCQAMKPVLARLEQDGTPVRHVDVAAEPVIARRYGIRKTPTYVIISGGKERTRLVGMQSVAQLQKAMQTRASGSLIPTNASRSTLNHSALTNIPAPQTRLAPLRGHANLNRTPRFQSRGLISATQTAAIESMPSVSLAESVERAAAATVRLRVFDGHGHDVGTGTIIDAHGDEALVMTCGHLFRESQGQGKIEVDLFVGGEVQTVQGRVLDFEAKHKDIALVTIRPGFAVQPVEVIGANERPRSGESVFSFGCDRGDDPTRRDTHVIGVNKLNQHLGASNIEIRGAPVSGRSGGGLFDSRGRLIGVCNAADYKDDSGIYTGPGSIRWQLDRVGMSELYKNPKNQLESPGSGSPGSRALSLAAAPAPQPAARIASLSSDGPSGLEGFAGKEVIVIVRDRGAPQSAGQILTLKDPPHDLMQRIENAARK